MSAESNRSVNDLVFAALNRRVVALDRYDGSIVWTWKAPQSGKYVSMLFDGDRLIVSVNGYLHCLDPLYGQEVWHNPLTGFGVGIASLASARGSTSSGAQAQTAAEQAAAGAAVAATSTAAIS